MKFDMKNCDKDFGEVSYYFYEKETSIRVVKIPIKKLSSDMLSLQPENVN